MELNIGDRVITTKRLVYGEHPELRELPEGAIGEIVGVGSRWCRVVFDYPGFRYDYVYATLGEEILPMERDEAPEVDVSALESILQSM